MITVLVGLIIVGWLSSLLIPKYKQTYKLNISMKQEQ